MWTNTLLAAPPAEAAAALAPSALPEKTKPLVTIQTMGATIFQALDTLNLDFGTWS